MEQTQKQKQNKGLRRFLWVLPLVALVFLALAVWSVSERYTIQFLPGTTVMGVDCANRTVEQAAAVLTEAADARQIVLGDSSGIEIGRIPLNAFLDGETLAAVAHDAFAEQRAGAKWYDWLMEGDRQYAAAPLADVDDNAVSATLKGLLYGTDDPSAPRDAHVEITDTGYIVVEAESGNVVNLYLCARALAERLRSVDDLSGEIASVILDAAAVKPSVTADSPEIEKITDTLDAYLDQTVSLEFENGNVYTLTSEDIRSVSDIQIIGSLVVCRPDTEKLREFVERIVTDYAPDGVFAKFLHASETRPYVYYRVGDKGWILDRDGLTAQLASVLESREGGTIVPDYDRTWYWKQYYRGYHVGDTYIEISLDNQYMWCYKDGALLVETPIVTGNLARRDDTRRGCFKIYYKVEDTILRGPTWNDHVDYWMPFDGGIGLHDSAWRDEYGEDIYMADGSHGCINTPLEAMKTIYENYNARDFVIVY